MRVTTCIVCKQFFPANSHNHPLIDTEVTIVTSAHLPSFAYTWTHFDPRAATQRNAQPHHTTRQATLEMLSPTTQALLNAENIALQNLDADDEYSLDDDLLPTAAGRAECQEPEPRIWESRTGGLVRKAGFDALRERAEKEEIAEGKDGAEEDGEEAEEETTLTSFVSTPERSNAGSSTGYAEDATCTQSFTDLSSLSFSTPKDASSASSTAATPVRVADDGSPSSSPSLRTTTTATATSFLYSPALARLYSTTLRASEPSPSPSPSPSDSIASSTPSPTPSPSPSPSQHPRLSPNPRPVDPWILPRFDNRTNHRNGLCYAEFLHRRYERQMFHREIEEMWNPRAPGCGVGIGMAVNLNSGLGLGNGEGRGGIMGLGGDKGEKRSTGKIGKEKVWRGVRGYEIRRLDTKGKGVVKDEKERMLEGEAGEREEMEEREWRGPVRMKSVDELDLAVKARGKLSLVEGRMVV